MEFVQFDAKKNPSSYAFVLVLRLLNSWIWSETSIYVWGKVDV